MNSNCLNPCFDSFIVWLIDLQYVLCNLHLTLPFCWFLGINSAIHFVFHGGCYFYLCPCVKIIWKLIVLVRVPSCGEWNVGLLGWTLSCFLLHTCQLASIVIWLHFAELEPQISVIDNCYHNIRSYCRKTQCSFWSIWWLFLVRKNVNTFLSVYFPCYMDKSVKRTRHVQGIVALLLLTWLLLFPLLFIFSPPIGKWCTRSSSC